MLVPGGQSSTAAISIQSCISSSRSRGSDLPVIVGSWPGTDVHYVIASLHAFRAEAGSGNALPEHQYPTQATARGLRPAGLLPLAVKHRQRRCTHQYCPGFRRTARSSSDVYHCDKAVRSAVSGRSSWGSTTPSTRISKLNNPSRRVAEQTITGAADE